MPPTDPTAPASAGGAAARAAAATSSGGAGAAARSNRQSTGGGEPGLPESALSGSLDTFAKGVNGLQAMLDGLVGAAATEREALKAERAALATERRALEAEKGRVRMVMSDSEQVTLNVGGSKFTTTVSTLRNSPADSLFAAMFSGRHQLQRGEDGAVFIDRDGAHFGQVLNYLRTRQLAYPQDGTDFKFLLELRAEAEFYGLSGLTTAIDRFPWSLVTVSRAAVIEEDAHWVLEDGNDDLVLSVSAPCQLLGVGLCGTHGGYTAQVHVMQVNPADFEQMQASLGSGTRTVTRADGRIARLDLCDPVPLVPGTTYMVSMVARGADAFVAEDCLAVVVAGGVRVTFLPFESANGTTELRGQIPELYIRPVG